MQDDDDIGDAPVHLVGPYLVPASLVQDVDDFLGQMGEDCRCQCGNPGVSPPCVWCTHPGNTELLLELGEIIYFGD